MRTRHYRGMRRRKQEQEKEQDPPQRTPRAQRKVKTSPQRGRAATKKQNPPRRHGGTEKNRRKSVAPRRRGEEFNFDEKFAQKTRKFGISNTETLKNTKKTQSKGSPQRSLRPQSRVAVSLLLGQPEGRKKAVRIRGNGFALRSQRGKLIQLPSHHVVTVPGMVVAGVEFDLDAGIVVQ